MRLAPTTSNGSVKLASLTHDLPENDSDLEFTSNGHFMAGKETADTEGESERQKTGGIKRESRYRLTIAT